MSPPAMRIGHYAPYLWTPGGISTYVRRLAAAQIDRGHDVVFFSRDDDGRTDTIEIGSDADLFRAAESKRLDVLHLHKSTDCLPPSSLPTLRTMHGHQASCPSASRYLARRSAPCSRTPSVGGCLWGHLIDRCGSARPGVITSNFARLRHEVAFASAVRTLPVSDYLRHRMIDAGCPPEQLRTLHSPAPTVEVSSSPVVRSGPPRFLFLGRLAAQKGILWLIRAFAHLKIDACLDVAGDGALLESARSLAEREGASDRITFHGWVDGDDVPALMSQARAVVFPSVWHEPAGLVSLEAAAHGRALIASEVGGIPEYARSPHAILVPPNDVFALARALETLANDADQANRMGQAGRAIARSQFRLDDFLDAIEQEYEQVRSMVGRQRPSLTDALD